jgi:tetratricopeptide (TPR) repeat protein
MMDDQTREATQKRKKHIKWIYLFGSAVAMGAIFIGILVWINHGKTIYTEAQKAYRAGECETAIVLYSKILRYPSFVGGFVAQAVRERDECLAYEQAENIDDHTEAIQVYETFLDDYPKSPLESRVLTHINEHYFSWGNVLRDNNDFAAAIEVYEQLAIDYSGHNRQAKGQIIETYMSWGRCLREDDDFATAIDIYEQLTTDYPQYKSEVMEQMHTTYLTWGKAHRARGDFSEAIAVYDEMSALGDSFADAALELRNQTYLDWGTTLIKDSEYSQAENIYWSLLQREHQRLAPLSLSSTLESAIWPYPYGVVKTSVNTDTLVNAIRSGPVSDYEHSKAADMIQSDSLLSVIGTNFDASWYAVNLGKWTDAISDFSNIRDIEWKHAESGPIVWIPFDQVTLVREGPYGIPPAYILIQALVAESEAASQALDGLEVTYTAWIKAVLDEGDLDNATSIILAQTELTPDTSTRQDAYEQVMHLQLMLAESLAADGDYEASMKHSLQAEDYAVSDDALIPARMLRINNFIAMGDLATDSLIAIGDRATDAHSWEIAADCYASALVLERNTFSSGGITVTTGTTLFSVPDLNSEAVRSMDDDEYFPVLAQQQDELGQNWILLLDPTQSTSRAWISADQFQLTKPLTAFVTYEAATLPSLQSHKALLGLAHLHLAWGESLYANDKYEEAIAQYQTIIDNKAMRQVITNTDALIVQTYHDYYDQGKLLLVQDTYDKALNVFQTIANQDIDTTLVTSATIAIFQTYSEWGETLSSEASQQDRGLLGEPTDAETELYQQAAYKFRNAVEWSTTPEQTIKATDRYMHIKTLQELSTHESRECYMAEHVFNLYKGLPTTTPLVGLAQSLENQKFLFVDENIFFDEDLLGSLANKEEWSSQLCNPWGMDRWLSTSPPADPFSVSDSESSGSLSVETADTPDEFRYAVGIDEDGVIVGSASYVDGWGNVETLHRKRVVWRVRVMDTRSGKFIAQRNFYGGTPPAFTQTAFGDFWGSKPNLTELSNWLQSLRSVNFANVADDYHQMGLDFLRDGDEEAALVNFTAVTKLDPQRVKSWWGRGSANYALGDYEVTVTDCEKVLELDPNHALAYNAIAWIYAEELESNLDKAVELALKAVELAETDKQRAASLDTLGWAYFKQKKYKDALVNLEEAHALSPDDVEIEAHLQAVQEALKE